MCDNTSSKALSMKAMRLSHMMRMLHEEKMRGMDPRASPGRVLAFLRLAEEVSVGDMTMVLGVKPHSLDIRDFWHHVCPDIVIIAVF
ncbi:MAG: hypothetical protein IKM91_06870 [Candidatus Methanomethylophilaceae archaeon]|nr:hypothetical protein [Candidatus Methanomethylophilaceae archaeon]